MKLEIPHRQKAEEKLNQLVEFAGKIKSTRPELSGEELEGQLVFSQIFDSLFDGSPEAFDLAPLIVRGNDSDREAALQIVENALRDVEARQHRERVETLLNLRRWSGIPEILEGKEATDWQATDATRARLIDAAVEYAERFRIEKREGLFLSGFVGVGKSLLAAIVCEGIMQRIAFGDLRLYDHDTAFEARLSGPMFIAADDLVYTARETARLRARGEFQDGFHVDGDELIRKSERSVLLCIDDLGREENSDFARRLIYRLFDRRYRAGRPTILTSNLNGSEIRRRYGNPFLDRIRETMIVVPFPRDSFRVRLAKDRQEEHEQ